MNLDELVPMQRPEREQMRPFEWIYWALVDAGMTREAEGMQYALMSFRGAMADALWQADRRHEAEEKSKAIARAVAERCAEICRAEMVNAAETERSVDYAYNDGCEDSARAISREFLGVSNG